LGRWRGPEPRRTPGVPPALLATLLVATLLVAAPGADAEPERGLRFAAYGEPVAQRDLGALRRAVSPRTVRVFEPYERREVAFRALPLRGVLDAVYGEAWREAGELLFTCRDGYQPTLPVDRILRHRGWLAFERPDRDGFWIRKRESGRRQRIELAPFYLVWENVGDERLRAQGDYGWPYQLVGMELIRPAERFPRMAPPEDASSAVRRGFAAFRTHCSRCHRIHGEGGTLGPELIGEDASLAGRDPGFLRRWIDDPEQMVPTARMPALNPELPERQETLDAIVAYLLALSGGGDGGAGGS